MQVMMKKIRMMINVETRPIKNRSSALRNKSDVEYRSNTGEKHSSSTLVKGTRRRKKVSKIKIFYHDSSLGK